MTCVPESNNQNGSTSYGGGSVAILRPALSDPMDCSPAGLYLWDFPGKIESGLPSLSQGDLPDPGIEPRSPALQVDFLPTESPGKPIRCNKD